MNFSENFFKKSKISKIFKSIILFLFSQSQSFRLPPINTQTQRHKTQPNQCNQNNSKQTQNMNGKYIRIDIVLVIYFDVGAVAVN